MLLRSNFFCIRIIFLCKNRNLYKKGLKVFFKFSKSFNDKKPSIETFLHIFDHTGKAVLMYGSEIWGCFHPNKLKSHKSFFNLCNDSIIEKQNVKSCKYILGIPRRCTNSSVMSELGRYSLYFSIILNLVKYWIRLEKSDNTLLKGSDNMKQPAAILVLPVL